MLSDANFPAASVGHGAAHVRALRMDCDALHALRAVLALLSIDRFEPDPVLTMQVVGDPAALPAVVEQALPMRAAQDLAPASLERFAFYEWAHRGFAVVRTAKTRLHGNFTLRKDVITL